MNKLAVVHYMPLEFYPPVTNLLDLAKKEGELKIKVWSTKNNKSRKNYPEPLGVSIKRASFPIQKNSGVVRLIKYFHFNLMCLFGLIIYRPNNILYYETYSAWPVYVYTKFFNNKTEVYIHHHEYFDKVWYDSTMKIISWYHALEKQFLFKRAKWISHTNADRINLFLKDHPWISKNKVKNLPNYPPKSWNEVKKKSSNSDIIRTIYVGSLSLSDTFIENYCEWVISQNGNIYFDIYAYNLHADTDKYLRNLNSKFINFFNEGVDYYSLPKVLATYDVGLILYKALSLNYKYNAPNKLFEYLVTGIEVWYPNTMLGIKPYKSAKVKSLDFVNLSPNIKDFNEMDKELPELSIESFTAEKALKPLIDKLTQ